MTRALPVESLNRTPELLFNAPVVLVVSASNTLVAFANCLPPACRGRTPRLKRVLTSSTVRPDALLAQRC
jgi:hypothetical protein